jgi:RecA-family ATPase
MLHLAAAIGVGGCALGSISVTQGEVLYFALEDNPRRLNERVLKLDGGELAAQDLRGVHFRCGLPKLNDGGLEIIKQWLQCHPDARMVIVDTFQKIKPPGSGSKNLYGEDYEAVNGLKALSDEFEVAIVLVHHVRKADSVDAVEAVSGTNGFTGAADSILVLRRERGQAAASLMITGRDVKEREVALKFDSESMSWRIIGDAESVRLTKERKEILDLLASENRAFSPKDIASELGRKGSNTRKVLGDMLKAGQVESPERGLYRLPGNNGNIGNIESFQPSETLGFYDDPSNDEGYGYGFD